MAKHGSIGEFDSDRETWKSYTERLTQYFIANDVESADKKRAILLSVCALTKMLTTVCMQFTCCICAISQS